MTLSEKHAAEVSARFTDFRIMAMDRLVGAWYDRRPWLILLVPLSLLYGGLTWLHRWLYRMGVLARYRMSVPVIVVGNITVGGTGKTPLVMWLVDHLKATGYRPGVVARGHKGKAQRWPQPVQFDSDPGVVGDEAVLLAGRCACPVVVGPDRVDAARLLLERNECDLIVSDDGLQHQRLERDIEIVVIDGARRFGNGLWLPAGPLRESPRRLTGVDLVVVNGTAQFGEYSMTLHPGPMISLERDISPRNLVDFNGESVHAVAGIGNPERFFACLRRAGLRLQEHVFPDHHAYRAIDLDFGDDRPLVMTEKDAVKCRGFGLRNCWYIPVTIELTAEFFDRVLDLLTNGGYKAEAEPRRKSGMGVG